MTTVKAPLFSYEQLPSELQHGIVNVLDTATLRNWCLVNRHAYILTLQRRYEHIKLFTPQAAYNFHQHPFHGILQSTRHVRSVSLRFQSKPATPSDLPNSGIDQYQHAIGSIPQSSLVSFSLFVTPGASYASEALPALLGSTSLLRRLCVTSLNESWWDVFEKTEFQALRHLIVCTTNRIFSHREYPQLLKMALGKTRKTLRTLDIAHSTTNPVELGTSAPISTRREGAKDAEDGSLECVNFQDLDFSRDIDTPFDWSVFRTLGPKCLRFRNLRCFDLVHGIRLAAVIPTWSTLSSFEIVLGPSSQSYSGQTLDSLEQVLWHVPNTALRNLRIELVGGSRLLDVQTLARHVNLRSLIVRVADTTQVYGYAEMEVLAKNCIHLETLGLDISPLKISDVIVRRSLVSQFEDHILMRNRRVWIGSTYCAFF